MLTLVIIFGIFVPALNYIKKTADESHKLRVYMEQKYEQSLRLRVTRNKLEEIKKSTADFHTYIFKTGDELKIITYLENLAAKYHVTQTINNSNLDKVGNNQITSISMNLAGNYGDALMYIAELETSDYFIYINSMRASPAFTRSGETTLNINLSLTIELYVNQ